MPKKNKDEKLKGLKPNVAPTIDNTQEEQYKKDLQELKALKNQNSELVATIEAQKQKMRMKDQADQQLKHYLKILQQKRNLAIAVMVAKQYLQQRQAQEANQNNGDQAAQNREQQQREIQSIPNNQRVSLQNLFQLPPSNQSALNSIINRSSNNIFENPGSRNIFAPNNGNQSNSNPFSMQPRQGPNPFRTSNPPFSSPMPDMSTHSMQRENSDSSDDIR